MDQPGAPEPQSSAPHGLSPGLYVVGPVLFGLAAWFLWGHDVADVPLRAAPDVPAEALAFTPRRQALGDPLEAIIEAIKATLDHCSPDLAGDLVSTGLVLCGGGSLLRRIDRFITEQTGLPARVAAEPLAAVANGMLICLEHFDKWRPTLQSSDDDI